MLFLEADTVISYLLLLKSLDIKDRFEYNRQVAFEEA